MRLNWKLLWLAMAPVMILSLTGCGGINASPSVSPASFFLPGLLKAEPRQPQPDTTDPEQKPAQQVAQVQ